MGIANTIKDETLTNAASIFFGVAVMGIGGGIGIEAGYSPETEEYIAERGDPSGSGKYRAAAQAIVGISSMDPTLMIAAGAASLGVAWGLMQLTTPENDNEAAKTPAPALT